MSEQIKAGDLVIVVRGRSCCGTGTKYIGRIKAVLKVGPVGYARFGVPWKCRNCQKEFDPATLIAVTNAKTGRGFMVDRLKKIDPPPIEQTTDTPEELCA
jgi:hypothetical protein